MHLVAETVLKEIDLSKKLSTAAGEKAKQESKKAKTKVIEISYIVNSVSNIDAKSNSYEVDIEVDFYWQLVGTRAKFSN